MRGRASAMEQSRLKGAFPLLTKLCAVSADTLESAGATAPQIL